MDKNTLYRFFTKTASFDEEAKVREWIELSDENRHELLSERRLFDMMLLNVKEEDAGAPVVRRQGRIVRFMKELAKIASVVAITFTVCYFYFYSQNKPVAMQTVSVPVGQRVNITLPDGTNVWLNARSILKYPVSFNSNQRILFLDGEAYFEVMRNKKKPFVVRTKTATVEVLGTDFNVENYTSENIFETTLMSGSLKVYLNDAPDSGVWLTPNEKAVLKNGQLQVEPVDDYTRYRWREGLICFSNTPFVDIMKDLEKYYGVTVKVNNPKVEKYSYTGKFRFTDGVNYALWVLQKDIRFTFRKDDEKQIIYIE